VSATIMSEYAGTKVRGMLVSLVFAMQGVGLIVGPLVAMALLAAGVSHDLAWRIMLALGAIPALSVYYMRRTMHETPRFAALAGAHGEAADATGRALGTHSKPPADEGPRRKTHWFNELAVYAKDRTMLRWLIGASLAWFLLDVAYYGNTLSSPLVVKAMNPNGSLITNTAVTLATFAIAAFPGYLVAAIAMDRLARLCRHRVLARRSTGGRAVRSALRHQLFLHGVWPQYDDVRVPVRDLSSAGAHDKPWHHRNVRQTWRLRRHVRVSAINGAVRPSRRNGDRVGRCHRRSTCYLADAAGT
jgi:MFS family permease